MEKKLNCWEFTRCGRYPGGPKAAELGVCPVTMKNSEMDGINGGTNGGRICWAVAGTLCKGELQGDFAKKCLNCKTCYFFQMVKDEQGSAFRLLLPGQAELFAFLMQEQ